MNKVPGSTAVKFFFLLFFSIVIFLFFFAFFPGSSVGDLVTF